MPKCFFSWRITCEGFIFNSSLIFLQLNNSIRLQSNKVAALENLEDNGGINMAWDTM
jgi:hypothetical protein